MFVLVPAGRRFDWPKVRAHLGVSRLSLPDADEAHAATGYVRETITPFGSSRAWPVILDASRPACRSWRSVAVRPVSTSTWPRPTSSPRWMRPSSTSPPERRAAAGATGGLATARHIWHDRPRCRPSASRWSRPSRPRSSAASRGTSDGWAASSTAGSSSRSTSASWRHRRDRRVAGHLLEKPLTFEIAVRLVQLGARHGPRPGRLGVRDVTRRSGGQLAADRVRGRDAGIDHRCARRAGRRFRAQGGSGIGVRRASRSTSSCAAGTAPRAT